MFEEATRLLHAEDPALAVQLHRCAAEILAASSQPSDQACQASSCWPRGSLIGSHGPATAGSAPLPAVT